MRGPPLAHFPAPLEACSRGSGPGPCSANSGVRVPQGGVGEKREEWGAAVHASRSSGALGSVRPGGLRHAAPPSPHF